MDGPAETAEARATVELLRGRFEVLRASDPGAERAAALAAVELPGRAEGRFSVTDLRSRLGLTASLRGARPAVAEAADGYVVYRGAHESGGDVLHRVVPEGTEDYISFDRAPESEEVVYDVALGDGVAGLRLVSNTLELLDAGGSPRLRIAAPYVIAAGGERVGASLSIEGCDADTSPAAPWGRPVIDPGARSCAVHVTWAGAGVTYPALLDPSWTVTGNMPEGHVFAQAALLANGKVLVAGGSQGVTGMEAALYDPASGTWSSTGSTSAPRSSPSLNVLPNGTALLAGGSSYLATTEIYDPATGTFGPGAPMITGRTSHVGVTLSSGKILVAGGTYPVVGLAEVYDPATGAWTSTATPMTVGRAEFASALLANGKVLLSGGASSGYQGSTEIYDPATNSFSAAAGMLVSRYRHTLTVLQSGLVLAVGNDFNGNSTTELYNPATNSWAYSGPMANGRYVHTATRLNDGKVVVAGGKGPNSLFSTQVYDPTAGTWSAGPDLNYGRYIHTATLLPNGEVLVAGGYTFGGPYAASAERYLGSNPVPVCQNIVRGAGNVADSYIHAGLPGQNFGTVTELPTGGASQILLQFDLSAIHAGATITSATLQVRASQAGGTVNVHEILAPWTESAVTWASFGGAFAPAVVASYPATLGFHTVDVLPTVQAWWSGSTANNGLLLESSAFSAIYSSEAAGSRPTLRICHVP